MIDRSFPAVPATNLQTYTPREPSYLLQRTTDRLSGRPHIESLRGLLDYTPNDLRDSFPKTLRRTHHRINYLNQSKVHENHDVTLPVQWCGFLYNATVSFHIIAVGSHHEALFVITGSDLSNPQESRSVPYGKIECRRRIWNSSTPALAFPSKTRWSSSVSAEEAHRLDRLCAEGYEGAAQRLSDLVEFLVEDALESEETDGTPQLNINSLDLFVSFLLGNRPKYPGPAIVCDDDGVIGMQWKIPQTLPPDENWRNCDGILYLEFLSEGKILCMGDIRDSNGQDDFRLRGKTSLDKIEKKLKPFTDRMDW